jgi:hypothetical protein
MEKIDLISQLPLTTQQIDHIVAKCKEGFMGDVSYLSGINDALYLAFDLFNNQGKGLSKTLLDDIQTIIDKS